MSFPAGFAVVCRPSTFLVFLWSNVSLWVYHTLVDMLNATMTNELSVNRKNDG